MEPLTNGVARVARSDGVVCLISQTSFHVHIVRKLNLRYTYMPFGSTPVPPCRLGEEQKHKAAQDEAETLKLEVEKVSGLEAANTELQSKVYIHLDYSVYVVACGMWTPQQ